MEGVIDMKEGEIGGELEKPAGGECVFDEAGHDHLRENLLELVQISAFVQVVFQD